MSKVVTQLTAVVVNEVSDEESEQLIENGDAESLSEIAENMEDDVEAIIAHKVFGDADEIALLNVNTEVEE